MKIIAKNYSMTGAGYAITLDQLLCHDGDSDRWNAVIPVCGGNLDAPDSIPAGSHAITGRGFTGAGIPGETRVKR